MNAPDALPRLGAHVRTIVTMPARNEERRIAHALAALVAQVGADGAPFEPRSYETIVFANGCTDATADVARAFAASTCAGRHTIHVVEAIGERAAHVGTARRFVMDVAYERLSRARRSGGWIATTDADSVAGANWLSSLDEASASGADAVLGAVAIAPADRSAFAPHAARLYAWHLAHVRARVCAEAHFDPVPWDPMPRHGTCSAASLAVRSDAYARAGGLPERACGEDAAFHEALVRIDARVRHSLRFRVTTSPRADGRVAGGFSKLVKDLHDASGPEQWLVEHPEATLARIHARAALRAFHGDRTDADAYRRILASYAIDFSRFAALFDATATFGANLDRFASDAAERGTFLRYGSVPVARAVAALRDARATAASRSAILTNVASGAG